MLTLEVPNQLGDIWPRKLLVTLLLGIAQYDYFSLISKVQRIRMHRLTDNYHLQ